MNKTADLHVHTHFSDSTASPNEVVQTALKQGLTCLGITDHDTCDGIAPAAQAAEGTWLEIIPGIEFSCFQQKRDIHILGYFLDCHHPELLEQLHKFQNARVERVYKMIDKLKEQGVDNIIPEDVLKLAESDAVGRPHLASVLVDKGWVSNIRSAFDRFLADDRPAYVPKFKQTPYEAIELIHQAGGAAVLAHPAVTNVDELIPGFVDAGLDGLEVYYPPRYSHTVRFYEGLARKYSLLMTGGSDAHGEDRSHGRIGDIKIPYSLVEDLKARAARYPSSR